jgi:hypothetical protein
VEPLVDVDDLERFMGAYDVIMARGQDLCWILGGRHESGPIEVKKLLKKYNWKFKLFYAVYNVKQMQIYGCFKRQKGLANSMNVEVLFMCYKGTVPKGLPSVRSLVDEGSSLWNQVMRNVPVLSPKLQAWVEPSLRNQSLSSMNGEVPVDDEDGEVPGKLHQPIIEETTEDKKLTEAKEQEERTREADQERAFIKKRKLYRTCSGTEIPWFPHDNDPAFTGELAWEGRRPRWVFVGTPASAAGTLGFLEQGCSVVALCYDEFHCANYRRFLKERAVEKMMEGSNVFKDWICCLFELLFLS